MLGQILPLFLPSLLSNSFHFYLSLLTISCFLIMLLLLSITCILILSHHLLTPVSLEFLGCSSPCRRERCMPLGLVSCNPPFIDCSTSCELILLAHMQIHIHTCTCNREILIRPLPFSPASPPLSLINNSSLADGSPGRVRQWRQLGALNRRSGLNRASGMALIRYFLVPPKQTPPHWNCSHYPSPRNRSCRL